MASLITVKKNQELDKALSYEINKQYTKKMKETVVEVEKRIKERVGVKSTYCPKMIKGQIGIYGPSSSALGALARKLF